MKTLPLTLQEPGVQTQMGYLQTVEFTGKLSTDQTGYFPVTSSRGSKYLMVLYYHVSNAILAEPLTSFRKRELIRATRVLHSYLYARGLTPQYQILDNEFPGGLKTFLLDSSVDLQLVPPYLNRTNAAERAIQTYKDHLVAGPSSCDSNFSLHFWYNLIPHATLKLNLLRPSRLNTQLSAEAQLNGAFDYNRTSLAPPGTRVVIYKAPGDCHTWSPHGVDSWYLGPAPDHYRCHRVYIPRTRAKRIAKTVDFSPHDCPVPSSISTSAATAAARALAEVLLHPTTTPFATLGDDKFAAIQALSRIFSNVTAIPPTAPAPMAPRPAPPVAVQPDLSTPSPRVSTLPPTALYPRVTIVSPVVTPYKPPPHPVSPATIRSAPCTRGPSPAQRPAIIEPNRDDPVFQSRYHLWPHTCLSPSNCWQAGTQPRYVAAFSQLPQQEEQANVVIDPSSGQALEYWYLIRGPDGATRVKALVNNLGCLAQGVGTCMPTSTNTIFFMPNSP